MADGFARLTRTMHVDVMELAHSRCDAISFRGTLEMTAAVVLSRTARTATSEGAEGTNCSSREWTNC